MTNIAIADINTRRKLWLYASITNSDISVGAMRRRTDKSGFQKQRVRGSRLRVLRTLTLMLRIEVNDAADRSTNVLYNL